VFLSKRSTKLSLSRGSAPVDFILVSVPMILLSISVLGVAVNGYAKNVAQDVAIDAARYGALADQDPAAGGKRASGALRVALGAIFAPQVIAETATEGDACVVRVTVTLTPLRLGLLGSSLKIRESGHAFCEIQ
jgi:Flp pilus assembly protein TadG